LSPSYECPLGRRNVVSVSRRLVPNGGTISLYMLDPVCSYDPVCKRGARFANRVDFSPVCKRGLVFFYLLTTPFANRVDNIQPVSKPGLAIHPGYKKGGLPVRKSTRFVNRVKIWTLEASRMIPRPIFAQTGDYEGPVHIITRKEKRFAIRCNMVKSDNQKRISHEHDPYRTIPYGTVWYCTGGTLLILGARRRRSHKAFSRGASRRSLSYPSSAAPRRSRVCTARYRTVRYRTVR